MNPKEILGSPGSVLPPRSELVGDQCESRGDSVAWLGFDPDFAQSRDLDAWRGAKQAPVFATELRWAFVADTMPGGGAFNAPGEHQPPRFVLESRHRIDDIAGEVAKTLRAVID